MINSRSSYDQVVKEIDEAVEEWILDQQDTETSRDELWTDMASSILVDASENVGREVCRTQIGWIPQDLERLWADRRAAKAAVARHKAAEHAAAKKALRAQKEKDARDAERSAVRAQRCGVCWTVRTPSGACNC